MALVIPNATDTTSGNRYQALDQAEPDALDFEIVGNTGSSGVVSGGAVTTNGSAANVAVAAAVIAVKGTAYTVAANATFALPNAPVDNRFDLIIARVSGATATLVAIPGNNSATNPTLPKSRSVVNAFDPAAHVDLATDVVLAALYRTGAGVVTASRITDKRTMLSTSLRDQGTGVPAPGRTDTGIGSMYYQKDSANSGVWIQKTDGTWIELAQNLGSSLPIGAMIMWPTTAALPSGCIEANGQLLSTTSYAALFAQYQYIHGGSGSSFGTPNMHHKHPRGTTTGGEVGQLVGADSFTILTANVPAHAHTMDHFHTHIHTHDMYHAHSGVTSTFAGGHRHDVVAPLGQAGGLAQYLASGSSASTFWGVSAQYPASGSQNGNQVSTDFYPGHTHDVYVPAFSGLTAVGSPSNTGGPSSATTGSIGSGTAITNIPASVYTRYIIRASAG